MNTVNWGGGASKSQVAKAITDYFSTHPIPAGKSVEMQIAGGYFQWRQEGGSWANLIAVPSDGKSVELQTTATAIQWRQTGGAWSDLVLLSAITGATGASGTLSVGTVTTLAAGASVTVTNIGTPQAAILNFGIPRGANGATGDPGATPVGTVVVGETAIVAIALGIREVPVALTGAVAGGHYVAFADSYKLNGGASVVGRPAGYALIDCVCRTAGQIVVSLNAPFLAIGASYAITCSIVRINA